MEAGREIRFRARAGYGGGGAAGFFFDVTWGADDAAAHIQSVDDNPPVSVRAHDVFSGIGRIGGLTNLACRCDTAAIVEAHKGINLAEGF